ESPSIADFLESAGPAARPELFRELLALELELRCEAGERPAPAEFLARFPDAEPTIRAVFEEIDKTTSLGSSRADRADDPPTGPCSAPGGRLEVGPNATIGDYELIEEIARGGMGVVFRARHKGLKRLVALKMILSGQMATHEERQRFLREAELAANLDHPNIVPIYEVDEHEDRPFFSMKLIEGESLSRQVARFVQDPAAAARMVAILARAVHYAHGQGFLHCDLKPSNVLIETRGRPYLTDFGLARRTGVESSLSISGAILGTPSYMAPEQATGSRAGLGPATDVYGLGAILYELLTGRPPFRAPTIMETVVQVLERDPAPPRELRPDLPRALESICLKCLEKSPRDRYATAEALADELDSYLQGDGIEAAGILSRLRRWNRREPELVARLGGLALMAVIAQINFHTSPKPHLGLHALIQSVLATWALLSVAFQVLLRSGRKPDLVRVLWSATDIVCMTIEAWLLESIVKGPTGEDVVHVETTLLVGYPLLIAASGLWWRVHLVWITTILAMLAFAGLHFNAALWREGGRLHWRPSPSLVHPNIFAAGLALTGYVVVRQVKRILALGRYYEHRGDQ
ncbi:MAG TPA: serine/threonine-protein kinase, partial [Isosphaeraceae bacterium]|nr:serine/threonine-protein kinase [Isosphaeraceae bacterium]